MPNQLFEKLVKKTNNARVYIVPSAIGFYFSFIAFVLFLIAISYGHNLAYFSTFLFFSFVSISAVVTNESVHAISIELVDQVARIQPHASSPYRLRVINKSRKDQYDIAIECLGKTLVLVDKIAGLESRDLIVDLSKLELERGQYKLARLSLSSRFPFGLFYAWKWVKLDLKLLVRPKPLRKQLRSFDQSGSEFGGVSHSVLIGNDEYYETRGHRAGESLSRIDRRHSQRFNFPQIRVFSREAQEAKVYDLRGEEVEENLSAACGLLQEMSPDATYGLIYPGEQQFVLGSGQEFKEDCLDRLSVLHKPIVEFP